MGLSTANPQVISGRAWRGFGVAALALGLLAACGGGGGGGGATVEAPVATSLTASTTTPKRGASFHLTPVYSNGTGAITYTGGTVTCPATGQASADLTANWSGARVYTLTVTNSANATATTTATVTPQTVSVAAISPATPSIAPSGTASFSTSVTGGELATVTWSVAVGTNADPGTIDASTGSYTAPASTGTVVVTATSVDDPTKSASTTATIAASGTASLAASATNPLYGATNVTITPTFTNAASAVVGTTEGGTDISASATSGQAIAVQSGGYHAAQTYYLRVIDLASVQHDTSVTITPQAVGLTAISPAAPNVAASGTANFSTTVSGGFLGTVTWSATAGTNASAGTINAGTGAWTAPASAGTVIITATSVDDASVTRTTTALVVADPTASLAASTTTPAWGDTTVTITPTFTGGTATVGTSVGGSELSGNAPTGVAIQVQHGGFVAAQTYYLRVTNAANVHHDDQVTITPTAVSLTALSPATPTIAAGGSTTFSTTPSGGYKGTVTWSAAVGTNAGAGSITSGGVYTAPATAGTVVITATSDDDATKAVSTTATVVAAPAITSFTVTQDTFTSGSTGAVAHATFAGGTGLITGGGIAAGGLSITSGGSVTITPDPTATSTYTLTVHSTALGSVDATGTAKALVGSLSILAGVPSGMGNIDGVVNSELGAKARFWMPNGMVSDGSGGFYVSDYENNCIRRITAAGVVSTPYGSLTGQHGTSDGTGNNARFFGPAGLATGGGFLYVADSWNQTIRKIGLVSGVVSTLAGSPALDGISKGIAGLQDGTASGGTSSGSSQFHFISDGSGSTPSLVPPGLALDVAGNTLYVADQINQCIRLIDTTTGEVTTGGMGSEYGTPGDGAGGPIDTLGNVHYRYPSGLLYDSGSGMLYVADYGNNAVRAIDTGAGTVTTLASTGLSGPVGLAMGTGLLYESDFVGSSINTVPLSPGVPTALAGSTGVTGSTDANGTSALFHSPSALVVSGGSLYVADSGNNTLRAVATGAPNAVTTFAGIAGNPDYSDSGTGLFNGPTGVVYDNGVVYVADTSNRAVRTITLSGGAVATPIYAGIGTTPGTFVPSAIAVNSTSHTVYVADDTAKTVSTISGTSLSAVAISGATFSKISGLAVDAAGTIYVADSDGTAVYKVTGGTATQLGSSFSYPVGLALSSDGTMLYVADGSDCVIYAQPTAGGARTVLAGTGVSGYHDGAHDVAQFAAVAGLAIDGGGNLYVADTTNNVVRKVTPAGYVTTVCGVSGTMANVENTGGSFALPASLAHPQAVAVVPTLDSGSNQMFIALADGILSIGF